MSGASWSAGELADSIREGDIEGNIDAVMADDSDLSDLLLYAEECLDDTENSSIYNEIARAAQTETLREARKSGDTSTMSAATGISSSRIDATGYDKLVDAIKPAAQQVLFRGPKGSGKSTKAVDIVRHLHSEFGGDLRVWTNIEGLEEHPDVEFGETASSMLEFAKEPGEKVVLADEMSTVLNAYGSNQNDVEMVFGRVINALRKSKGGSTRLIAIGHENDSDIHPLIRKQSDVVIEAAGKVDEGLIDCANIYRGWQAWKKDDEWFSVRGLQDISNDSPWSFDSNYFAHFEIDLDDPETQIQRGQLIDGWEEFQDDESENSEDESDRVKCRGTNSEGEGCGSMTTHKSGYCDYHRDQWDGEEPDDRRAS